MADPISVSTGIVTIATAAVQISKAISHLRRLGQVPGQVYAPRNEITDLEVVLRQVATAAEQETLPSSDFRNESFRDMLARAASDLTELSKALERIGRAVEQSRAKGISRTAVWAREKSRLHKLQVSIQTVREAFGVLLGASNARTLHQVHLVLHGASTRTEQLEQLQECSSNIVAHSFCSQDAKLKSYPSQHRQDSRDDHDLLKGESSSQCHAEKLLEYIDKSPTSEDKVKEETSRLGSHCIVAAQLAPRSNWCSCACHVKQKINATNNGIMERLLGKMFVGYAGIPQFFKPCDFRNCRHNRGPYVALEYCFPEWFASVNIKLGFTYFRATGPQFQLATTMRVPDTAPVINCVMQSDIKGLKHLFSNGFASVRDVSASRGFTLMRWALYGEWRYDVVQFLLSQRAPVDDESYESVFDYMYRGQIPQKAQQELRCITADNSRNWVEDQNFPLIHRIVFGLSSKSLEVELQESPTAVYLTDAQGRTALDWASARAQVEDVALLLAKGSDPNTMDCNGRSAVLHCVDNANIPCLRLLLKAGACSNPKLPKGVYRSSPLAAAASGGKRDVIQALLEYDADTDVATPEGLTPLHIVAKSRDAACALTLLEHGADLNAVSRDGQSPLTTAIAHNNHDVLRLFIDRCYEYITSIQLRGPQLLPIIAESADTETMSILANSHPLKLSYNLKPERVTESQEILQKRQDCSEKLSAAFEELISIAQAKTPATASTESFLEASLFISAKSSFCSDLAEAIELLNSPTSPVKGAEESVVDLQGA